MFQVNKLKFENNLFDELSNSIKFEETNYGVKAANLVKMENDLMPIVRTTSFYSNKNQEFLPIHYNIINNIKEVFNGINIEFNNALIEIYDNNYRKMGFHSDQCLDLTKDSFICIFSCYQDDKSGTRTLVVKDKMSNDSENIVLNHNSIVMFSTETNKRYLHKIILDNAEDNRWLGITFRLSKTFIHFINEVPYFYGTEKKIKYVDANEIKEMYKYKSLENSKINYEYPDIYFTLNKGDIQRVGIK
jgi:hypothetical protein